MYLAAFRSFTFFLHALTISFFVDACLPPLHTLFPLTALSFVCWGIFFLVSLDPPLLSPSSSHFCSPPSRTSACAPFPPFFFSFQLSVFFRLMLSPSLLTRSFSCAPLLLRPPHSLLGRPTLHASPSSFALLCPRLWPTISALSSKHLCASA